MMTNLFSIFDPSMFVLFYMNWMVFILLFTLVLLSYFNFNNNFYSMLSLIQSILLKELSSLLLWKMKGFLNMFISLFFFIFFLNFSSLFPYNFTLTAQISLTFSMSLIMWLMIYLFMWVNNFNFWMSHLVPMGTPLTLMNFMVLIELISGIIRPITLSVRLTANMVAGHLLISLLGSFSMSMLVYFLSSYIFFMILSILEIFVSIIQAYVMVVLLTLYSSEINYEF